MSSGEPSSNVASTTLAGSPESAESITAATSSDPNAPGRATQFSSVAAHPSTTASRDIRKDPIPAPGAPGSSSSSSSSYNPSSNNTQTAASGSQSAGSGSGGGKSLFDETPEQAEQKKDYLRKLSSGNKEAIKQFEEAHKNDGAGGKLDTSKPVNPNAQMDVEQWGDKDPVYNSKAAAKDDYYTPAKNPNEEVQEDVTVAATKLLLADPTEVAQAAKQSGGK